MAKWAVGAVQRARARRYLTKKHVINIKFRAILACCKIHSQGSLTFPDAHELQVVEPDM